MKLNWKMFGRELKSMRIAADLGLREVCRDTEIHHSAWCRAEQGKPVSVTNYLALCSWMEIHPFRHFWQSAPVVRRTVPLQERVEP